MKEMKKLLCSLLFLITGWQVAQAQDLSRFKVLSDSTYQTTEKQSDNKYKKETNIKMNKEMKFCQSCGMPLTEDVLGTNADGSKNEDYCMYCYRDGKFLHDMIDVDFSEDLIPPDDFEEEFPTLKFTNRELYEIAKNYWKDLYVRADDDLFTIELKEYRECNDSGLPMYIPRRLLYDVKGISPMIKTDIYILMNMEDGMDRIEEEDLKIFESFENLQNIHIIASLDEYEEEDLIIPQDKYTVLLGDSIG